LNAFSVAFHHASPHGVMSAIHIPDTRDPVPDDVLARLPGPEAEYARTLQGFRQVSFVGGRLALHAAAEQIGARPGPVLPDERGAPVLPQGIVGSVSHKRELAAAMVARDATGTLGVDLEDYGPPRLAIAPKVLTPEEVAEIEPLPEDRRWFALLLRFSIKEAIYKALDPFVRRYVAFDEARVTPGLDGAARVDLDLAGGEGPFDVDARYEWLRGRIFASVRIRRRGVNMPPDDPGPPR
jgi:4'-phosphopantetheinyl transferase EntD